MELPELLRSALTFRTAAHHSSQLNERTKADNPPQPRQIGASLVIDDAPFFGLTSFDSFEKSEESMGNIFSEIASAEHTFAAWAEKELAKLYAEAPKIEQIASTVLTYAGPALQTVVTAEAGSSAGAIVGSVLKEAQSDLVVASGLVYDLGANPSVASFVASIKNNLSELLTAGHITNSASVSTVTKVVSSLGALSTALAAPAPAAAK